VPGTDLMHLRRQEERLVQLVLGDEDAAMRVDVVHPYREEELHRRLPDAVGEIVVGRDGRRGIVPDLVLTEDLLHLGQEDVVQELVVLTIRACGGPLHDLPHLQMRHLVTLPRPRVCRP
jgi:hypothetical protein